MNELAQAFTTACRMVASFDPALGEIVLRSLQVSLTAVFVASLIGLPLGAALALLRFPGRGALTVLVNAMMGLPPVVVGLVVYLALSRSGPFGVLGLLFTPTAMVTAQTILILPIVAALTRESCAGIWAEYREQLASFGVGPGRAIPTVLWDARRALATSVLAGFGRASAEVGAVMIVGGNIDHVTRVMTTAIALETSKGDLALALALGMVLIVISISINAATYLLARARTAEAA